MASTSEPHSSPLSSGAIGAMAAALAFVIWGILPLYWARLSHVPPLDVIWHRVLWGGALAWLITMATGSGMAGGFRGTGTGSLFPPGRTTLFLGLNGVMLVFNWLVYVWAITAGLTLDASLGYYMNPLVNVVLGMLFFRERLRPLQWVAVGLAATGVLYMTLQLGRVPWVSLVLAGTFGLYGVVKKRSSLASIHSLAVELTPMMVVAAVMVLRGLITGSGGFFAGNPGTTVLLLGASVVTVAPLLLFGIAARRIRLADVGFLQYVAPTMMFLIAVFIFGDPVANAQKVGFSFVWSGLIIYTLSTIRGKERTP